MTLRLLIILTLLTGSAFRPTSDSDIKKIDNYKLNIDGKLKAKKLIEKFYPNMSRLGGAVYGYYEDKKLVLIKTQFNGEFGYHSLDFYLLNDTLVYAFEKERYIKEPDDHDKYDEYIKKYTDKEGNLDLTKIPLSVCTDNTYYLNSNTIFHCQLKSFGKKTKVMEDVVAEKNKMIIQHFKSHLDELAKIK